MELFLPEEERICLECRNPLEFQQLLYGCAFVCKCKTLNFAAEFEKFIERINDLNHRAFRKCVPCITAGKMSTAKMKLISVELNFMTDEVEILFKNFEHVDETLSVLHEFSSALGKSLTKKSENRYSVARELYDNLLEELESATLGKYVVNFPPDKMVHLFTSTKGEADTVRADIPSALNLILKQHQREGIVRALSMGGRALVADEMGVGKTLFALGVIASLKSYPCLIVCPSTIKFIWAEAVEKYLFEQVSLQDVLVVHDSSDMPSLKETPKIVIISYQMLVQLQDIISGIKWVNVICDESHFIHTNSSGKDAQYTELLLRLSREIPFCLLLTGSPLSLSVFDMFNQIDMVCPGALGKTRWEFAVQYCHVFVEPYLRIGKCTRMNEFSSFVRSKCMIRRLKKDVLDLPQKARFLYPVKVSSRSTNRGGNFATKYCASWRRKSEGIMRAVESLLSCHGRLVLFAHHKELIGFLQAQLGSRGILYLTIDGTVPQPDRSRLLDDFSQEKVNVAIVSIKACAVGVSLATATCAVFCELPPNISWMRQAEDRLHRMGQENAVTVYYLFGEGDAFDEEHLKKIQLSHQETRRITEADLLEFCTLPTTVKNRAAERLNNTGCFQAPSLASDHQLLFTVSKNTKRVHVKSVDGSSYWTFSPDEAHDVVHRRSLPLWQQIDQFLANYYRLSSYGRRKLRGTWVSPSNFGESNPKLSPAQSASRSRYTRSLRAGWGFWWKIRRQYGTHFYFCTLRKDGAQYDATCLYCGVSLGNRTRPVPGAVIGKECDVSLFCSGSCRRRFYFQRSSGFIRRSLADDDGGVCARCGVDCKSLYMRLIRTSSPADRVKIVEVYHPDLLNHPKLLQRIVTNPTPGACWNADHIIPVCMGGGEARQENMQTLCVVCHAIKTRGEQNHYVSSATSQTVETTVSAGAARMFAVNHQGRAVKLRLTQH